MLTLYPVFLIYRHASVGELLRDEPFFLGIVAQLPLFSQLESLCASLAQVSYVSQKPT